MTNVHQREFLQILERVSSEVLVGEASRSELRRVLGCIHENLFDPGLSVKLIKNHCGIRDNNISSRFRRYLGISIRQYIEALRMEAAGKLLRESSLTVFDVALCLGYEYPQTFYGAFRRYFGCTPVVYRARAEAGLPSDGQFRRGEGRMGDALVLSLLKSIDSLAVTERLRPRPPDVTFWGTGETHEAPPEQSTE